MHSIDYLPLGEMTASNIRDIKTPGFLIPTRSSDDPILLTEWDGNMFAIMGAGSHSFVYFPVKIDTPRTGLFVPKPEILIDHSSIQRAVGGHEYVPGTLFLDCDALSVAATPVGNSFPDAALVPLWASVNGGSDDSKVCFTRWALGVPSPTGHHILQRFDALSTSKKSDT